MNTTYGKVMYNILMQPEPIPEGLEQLSECHLLHVEYWQMGELDNERRGNTEREINEEAVKAEDIKIQGCTGSLWDCEKIMIMHPGSQ